MTHFKLIAELERDIRNQVVIDRMKRLSLGARIKIMMLRYHPRLPLVLACIAATLWTFACVLWTLFVNWP